MKNFQQFVVGVTCVVSMIGFCFHLQAQPASIVPPRKTTTQSVEYQKMLRQLKSPETTGEQHRTIIIKAQEKDWLTELIPDYHRVTRQRPNDPVLLSAFGHAFSRLSEPVLNRPHRDHDAYVKVSRTFYSLAHEALDKAIKGKGKEIAFCWYAAGWANVSPGAENRCEGKRQLQKALEIDSRFVYARYRLAFAHLVQDADYSPEEALKEAQKASLVEPNSAKPYYYQALARFELKQYSLAYQLLLKAQKMEPNSIAKWMIELYKEKAASV